MTTQEIANFIKSQLKLGSTRAEIEKILILNHIDPKEIGTAFDLALSESGITLPPAEKPAPTAATPAAATADRAFPPPATAFDSVDSVVPTPPTPPAQPKPAMPPPPPAPRPPEPITPPPTPIRPATPPVPPTPPIAPKLNIPVPPLPPKPTATPPAMPTRPPVMTMPNAIKPMATTAMAINTRTASDQKAASRGIGKWIALILVLIILAIGGTAAYAYIAKPTWAQGLPDINNLLNKIPGVSGLLNTTPTPDEALTKMYAAITQVKSLGYDVTLSASSSLPSSYFGFISPGSQGVSSSSSPSTPTDNFVADVSIKLTGQGDFNDLSNSNNSSNLIIGGKAGTSGMEMSANLDMSFIRINKTNYLKVDRMPSLIPLPAGVNGFLGQWIKIGQQDIASGSQSLTGQDNISNLSLTKEEMDSLKQELVNDGIIKLGNFIAKENINGKPTYSYSLIISKDGLKKGVDTISRLSQKMQEKMSTSTDPASKIELERNLAETKASIDKLNLPDGKIWLGQTDFLPYKVTFDKIEIPLPAMDGQSSSKVNMAITAQYKDFNQPISITAPADTKSFEELMTGIFGGMRSDSASSKIISTLSSMRSEAEIIYGDNKLSYAGLCKAKAMIDADKAIKDAGAGPLTCNVKTNGKEYAISAKLVDGGYFCVDSTGFAVKVEAPSTTGATVCPKQAIIATTTATTIKPNTANQSMTAATSTTSTSTKKLPPPTNLPSLFIP